MAKMKRQSVEFPFSFPFSFRFSFSSLFSYYFLFTFLFLCFLLSPDYVRAGDITISDKLIENDSNQKDSGTETSESPESKKNENLPLIQSMEAQDGTHRDSETNVPIKTTETQESSTASPTASPTLPIRLIVPNNDNEAAQRREKEAAERRAKLAAEREAIQEAERKAIEEAGGNSGEELPEEPPEESSVSSEVRSGIGPCSMVNEKGEDSGFPDTCNKRRRISSHRYICARNNDNSPKPKGAETENVEIDNDSISSSQTPSERSISPDAGNISDVEYFYYIDSYGGRNAHIEFNEIVKKLKKMIQMYWDTYEVFHHIFNNFDKMTYTEKKKDIMFQITSIDRSGIFHPQCFVSLIKRIISTEEGMKLLFKYSIETIADLFNSMQTSMNIIKVYLNDLCKRYKRCKLPFFATINEAIKEDVRSKIYGPLPEFNSKKFDEIENASTLLKQKIDILEKNAAEITETIESIQKKIIEKKAEKSRILYGCIVIYDSYNRKYKKVNNIEDVEYDELTGKAYTIYDDATSNSEADNGGDTSNGNNVCSDSHDATGVNSNELSNIISEDGSKDGSKDANESTTDQHRSKKVIVPAKRALTIDDRQKLIELEKEIEFLTLEYLHAVRQEAKIEVVLDSKYPVDNVLEYNLEKLKKDKTVKKLLDERKTVNLIIQEVSKSDDADKEEKILKLNNRAQNITNLLNSHVGEIPFIWEDYICHSLLKRDICNKEYNETVRKNALIKQDELEKKKNSIKMKELYPNGVETILSEAEIAEQFKNESYDEYPYGYLYDPESGQIIENKNLLNDEHSISEFINKNNNYILGNEQYYKDVLEQYTALEKQYKTDIDNYNDAMKTFVNDYFEYSIDINHVTVTRQLFDKAVENENKFFQLEEKLKEIHSFINKLKFQAEYLERFLLRMQASKGEITKQENFIDAVRTTIRNTELEIEVLEEKLKGKKLGTGEGTRTEGVTTADNETGSETESETGIEIEVDKKIIAKKIKTLLEKLKSEVSLLLRLEDASNFSQKKNVLYVPNGQPEQNMKEPYFLVIIKNEVDTLTDLLPKFRKAINQDVYELDKYDYNLEEWNLKYPHVVAQDEGDSSDDHQTSTPGSESDSASLSGDSTSPILENRGPRRMQPRHEGSASTIPAAPTDADSDAVSDAGSDTVSDAGSDAGFVRCGHRHLIPLSNELPNESDSDDTLLTNSVHSGFSDASKGKSSRASSVPTESEPLADCLQNTEASEEEKKRMAELLRTKIKHYQTIYDNLYQTYICHKEILYKYSTMGKFYLEAYKLTNEEKIIAARCNIADPFMSVAGDISAVYSTLKRLNFEVYNIYNQIEQKEFLLTLYEFSKRGELQSLYDKILEMEKREINIEEPTEKDTFVPVKVINTTPNSAKHVGEPNALPTSSDQLENESPIDIGPAIASDTTSSTSSTSPSQPQSDNDAVSISGGDKGNTQTTQTEVPVGTTENVQSDSTTTVETNLQEFENLETRGGRYQKSTVKKYLKVGKTDGSVEESDEECEGHVCLELGLSSKDHQVELQTLQNVPEEQLLLSQSRQLTQTNTSSKAVAASTSGTNGTSNTTTTSENRGGSGSEISESNNDLSVWNSDVILNKLKTSDFFELIRSNKNIVLHMTEIKARQIMEEVVKQKQELHKIFTEANQYKLLLKRLLVKKSETTKYAHRLIHLENIKQQLQIKPKQGIITELHGIKNNFGFYRNNKLTLEDTENKYALKALDLYIRAYKSIIASYKNEVIPFRYLNKLTIKKQDNNINLKNLKIINTANGLKMKNISSKRNNLALNLSEAHHLLNEIKKAADDTNYKGAATVEENEKKIATALQYYNDMYISKYLKKIRKSLKTLNKETLKQIKANMAAENATPTSEATAGSESGDSGSESDTESETEGASLQDTESSNVETLAASDVLGTPDESLNTAQNKVQDQQTQSNTPSTAADGKLPIQINTDNENINVTGQSDETQTTTEVTADTTNTDTNVPQQNNSIGAVASSLTDNIVVEATSNLDYIKELTQMFTSTSISINLNIKELSSNLYEFIRSNKQKRDIILSIKEYDIYAYKHIAKKSSYVINNPYKFISNEKKIQLLQYYQYVKNSINEDDMFVDSYIKYFNLYIQKYSAQLENLKAVNTELTKNNKLQNLNDQNIFQKLIKLYEKNIAEAQKSITVLQEVKNVYTLETQTITEKIEKVKEARHIEFTLSSLGGPIDEELSEDNKRIADELNKQIDDALKNDIINANKLEIVERNEMINKLKTFSFFSHVPNAQNLPTETMHQLFSVFSAHSCVHTTCPENAGCFRDLTGSELCRCFLNYKLEDGKCIADPHPSCSVNNGGCAPEATCIETDALVSCACPVPKSLGLYNGIFCSYCPISVLHMLILVFSIMIILFAS